MEKILLLAILFSGCATAPKVESQAKAPMAPLAERKQACLKDPKTCSKIKWDGLDLKSESAVLVQNFCLFQKRPEACLEAGNRFFNLSKMDKAKRFYKEGCDLKDQTSCKKLADMTPRNQTEIESPAEAKKAQLEGTASNPSDGPADVAQAEPFAPLNAFVGFNPYETRSDICHHYCEAPDAFTLFKDEGKVIQLKPTKLKQIINDCNGEKVLVNPINGIANLKGSLFKSGKVVGEELSENLNGIASLSFNNITHTITRSPSGELILKNGQKQQTLLQIGSATVENVELVFKGDLDRDGKMDLIIEVRYSEGVATYLFLSSPAKEDQIVNPDAYLDVKNLDVGC